MMTMTETPAATTTPSETAAMNETYIENPELLLPPPQGFSRRDAWIIASIVIYGGIAALLGSFLLRGNTTDANAAGAGNLPVAGNPGNGTGGDLQGAAIGVRPTPTPAPAPAPDDNATSGSNSPDANAAASDNGALADANTNTNANVGRPANEPFPDIEGVLAPDVGVQFDGDYLVLSWDLLSSFTFSNYSFADLLEKPELAKLHNPVPSGLLALDGKQARIIGYCWPEGKLPDGRYQTTVFRDMGACCFGDIPQLNHFCVVYTNEPVNVPRGFVLQLYGKLRVEVEYDPDGYPIGLYTLQCDRFIER